MRDEPADVIVGVDGSEHARQALRWAVAKTEILGPIVPVLAYTMQPLGAGLGMADMYADVERIIAEDAEARLRATIEEFPHLTSRAKLVARHPGPALVSASADAGLLVVGSRGRSALAETLFGSVGSYCVKHATVPVAVVTEEAGADPTISRAVVGIDGSANSTRALEWAVRHVDPSGRVIAAGCWTDHVFGEPPLPNPELERSTTKLVDEVIAQVAPASAGDAELRPTIEPHIQRGDPRIVLRELASSVDLLVLGARGHRGVSYLLLGSTTSSLLHHPTSPTVVVP